MYLYEEKNQHHLLTKNKLRILRHVTHVRTVGIQNSFLGIYKQDNFNQIYSHDAKHRKWLFFILKTLTTIEANPGIEKVSNNKFHKYLLELSEAKTSEWKS